MKSQRSRSGDSVSLRFGGYKNIFMRIELSNFPKAEKVNEKIARYSLKGRTKERKNTMIVGENMIADGFRIWIVEFH